MKQAAVPQSVKNTCKRIKKTIRKKEEFQKELRNLGVTDLKNTKVVFSDKQIHINLEGKYNSFLSPRLAALYLKGNLK